MAADPLARVLLAAGVSEDDAAAVVERAAICGEGSDLAERVHAEAAAVVSVLAPSLAAFLAPDRLFDGAQLIAAARVKNGDDIPSERS